MALTSLEAGQSFLLDQFWEFYSEVIRLKRSIVQQQRIAADEDVPAPAPGAPPPRLIDAQQAIQTLQAVLERQAYQARRQGGEFGAALYREAQYVMAALADETFLHGLARDGRASNPGLLEQRLFKTQIAGERFYENVDRLLAQREKSHVELAAVYLLALHLGFRGKYRGGSDNGKIQAYLTELFEFIFGRAPDLMQPNRLLMEQPYGYTLAERIAPRMPAARRWKRAILIVLLVQLVIGQLIWVSETDDLDRAARQVIQTARAMGL